MGVGGDVEAACFFVEPGWENVLAADDDGEEQTVWVSKKRRNAKGKHSNLRRQGTQVVSETTELKGFTKNPRVLCISWAEDDAAFVAPRHAFKLTGQISDLDVSAGGLGLAAVGNNVLVFDSQTGTVRREFSEHVAEVETGRLFPSGIVALTGGIDMQLKVWSCTDGKCPVTFKGHTKAVTDTAMLGRGKNVVSVSRDGTCKTWNCAEASCKGTIEIGEPLNCCWLIGASNNEDEGLQGKVLVVGGEEGCVAKVDLAAQTILHRYKCESAVNAVTSVGQTIVAGCENGEVLIFSTQLEPSQTRRRLHSSSSPVTAIHPQGEGFVVGRKDGTATVHNINSHTSIYLTGPDNDTVSGISSDAEFIYTSSRDGLVRKYKREDIALAQQG